MNQMEIARKLKISQTTVSLVLNNPSTIKVSREKRQKIMDMMRDTSYLLKASRGKTWNIGYILGSDMNVENNFYNRFFLGIQKSSMEAGYHVIVDNENICNSRLITNRKVDGIILADKLSTDVFKDLAREIPLILLNYSPLETLCDTVVPDNQGGIIKAFNHLIELGHCRIAFLGILPPGGKIDGLLRDRKNIFENESKLRGLPINQDFIQTPTIKIASADETETLISETLAFWMNLPEFPTAAICSNDLYAAMLLRAAAEKHVKVPGDLSVIGIDNTDKCECTYPALTSIDHNAMEMGSLAVELFLKRISNPARFHVKTSCDSALVIRKSTGPLKTK